MDDADAGSVFETGKRPGYDGFQLRAVADIRLVPALPGIDEAFVRRDLEHLTVNGPVPGAGRRRLVGETIAFDRLETFGRHQPAGDQFARGQRLPDRLRSMRKHLVDHDVVGLE